MTMSQGHFLSEDDGDIRVSLLSSILSHSRPGLPKQILGWAVGGLDKSPSIPETGMSTGTG